MPADSPSPAFRDGPTEPGSDGSSGRAAVSLKNVLSSLLLSALVLGGIGYYTFDAAAFREMLGHIHPWLLGAAVVTTLLRVAVGGWRLSFVSQGRLDLRGGTRGQLAWEFFSAVTPSAIGGGPVTALYVARDRGITVGEATAFMLFCMLLDQFWFVVAIPVIVAATFALPVIPAAVGSVGMWTFLAYFGGLLGWSALFAYATLVRPALLEQVADWVFQWPYLRRFRERVLREMHAFARRARRLREEPLSFYVKGFLLTALTWIGRYALVLLIVLSVYPAADTLLVGLRTVALTLVGLAMPTPGGSGGLEGLYALFIGPLMPDALVAPTLLTWRFLGYYLFIALGAFLFTHQVQRALAQNASPGPPPQPSAADGAAGEPAAADAPARSPSTESSAAAAPDPVSKESVSDEPVPGDDT
jgi:hypothetical protein